MGSKPPGNTPAEQSISVWSVYIYVQVTKYVFLGKTSLTWGYLDKPQSHQKRLKRDLKPQNQCHDLHACLSYKINDTIGSQGDYRPGTTSQRAAAPSPGCNATTGLSTPLLTKPQFSSQWLHEYSHRGCMLSKTSMCQNTAHYWSIHEGNMPPVIGMKGILLLQSLGSTKTNFCAPESGDAVLYQLCMRTRWGDVSTILMLPLSTS